MISLSPARRGIYFVFGLPALFLSLLAPLSIYAGGWAYFTGADKSAFSLLWYVLVPLLGATATVSGLMLIAGRKPSSGTARIAHTGALCAGIAISALFAGPGDIGFRLFVLAPAFVAVMLVYHLWQAPPNNALQQDVHGVASRHPGRP